MEKIGLRNSLCFKAFLALLLFSLNSFGGLLSSKDRCVRALTLGILGKPQLLYGIRTPGLTWLNVFHYQFKEFNNKSVGIGQGASKYGWVNISVSETGIRLDLETGKLHDKVQQWTVSSQFVEKLRALGTSQQPINNGDYQGPASYYAFSKENQNMELSPLMIVPKGSSFSIQVNKHSNESPQAYQQRAKAFVELFFKELE